MREIKIPFAQSQDGRMVAVDAVMRGLSCECCCPGCQSIVVAVKGELRRHHFRHYHATCNGAGETALHRYAKQLIAEKLDLLLPDGIDLGPMRRATVEQTVADGLICDVLAVYNGESVAVEILVEHQVPMHKVRRYNDRQQAAVEIDLRMCRRLETDEARWQEIVLQTANRVWLSPPRQERARRKAEREAKLVELLKEHEATLNRLKIYEQARIDLDARLKQIRNDEQVSRNAVVDVERQYRDARIVERTLHAEIEHQQARLERAQTELPEADARMIFLARQRSDRLGPDLDALVAAFGSYCAITPEAWQTFDEETKQWNLRRIAGEFHRFNVLPSSVLGVEH